jgi:hypothetical protein
MCDSTGMRLLCVYGSHRYEVKLSGYAEHKTVKPPEWLSPLRDKLARIVAKILYARETSKPEKQDLDLSGPAP